MSGCQSASKSVNDTKKAAAKKSSKKNPNTQPPPKNLLSTNHLHHDRHHKPSPSLHTPLRNRTRQRAPLILPSLQRPQQLHDLIPLPLPHIINAHAPHLHIIVQQKVEQPKEPIELVVVRVGGEGRVGHGRRGGPAFDGLGEAQQCEAAAERAGGVGDLQVRGQVRVGPVDEGVVDDVVALLR